MIPYTGVKKALDPRSPANCKLLTDDSVSDIENGNKIKYVPKFFYYWVLLMEEDNKEVTKQEGFRVLSGNVPLTNGSGSMKP